MQLPLTVLPYLEPLLRVHEKIGQQPDNLCGPYWLSLLLMAYGGLSISVQEVAIATSTVLPSQGNPTDWIPPNATSLQGPGYADISTTTDLDACGTSITGLIHATKRLSQGRFCLIPLQSSDWINGLATLFQLYHQHPDWQIIPIMNVHTSYFWGSQLTPWSLFSYLQAQKPTDSLPLSPADWKVGHFAILGGQLQGNIKSLYAILDTYPQFGWNGLHLQPAEAVAQSLHRPNQITQGGIALFLATEFRSPVERWVLRHDRLSITAWDNGSPMPTETF